MVTKTITVLDPTVKPKSKEFKMAVRPGSLGGKVVGFLWNSKPNADVLLDRLAQRLDERYHFAQIVKRDKPRAGQPSSEEVLNELSTKCDFVFIAVGD